MAWLAIMYREIKTRYSKTVCQRRNVSPKIKAFGVDAIATSSLPNVNKARYLFTFEHSYYNVLSNNPKCKVTVTLMNGHKNESFKSKHFIFIFTVSIYDVGYPLCYWDQYLSSATICFGMSIRVVYNLVYDWAIRQFCNWSPDKKLELGLGDKAFEIHIQEFKHHVDLRWDGV